MEGNKTTFLQSFRYPETELIAKSEKTLLLADLIILDLQLISFAAWHVRFLNLDEDSVTVSLRPTLFAFVSCIHQVWKM